MLAILLRFLIWAALCSAVYFGAKALGWSTWLLPVFAFGSLGLYLWLAARKGN